MKEDAHKQKSRQKDMWRENRLKYDQRDSRNIYGCNRV